MILKYNFCMNVENKTGKIALRIIWTMITSVMLLLLSGCGDDNKSFIDKGGDALEALDYGTAASMYDSAIQAGEEAQLAYRGKGMALLGLSRYSEAEQMFLKALSESNGNIGGIEYDIAYYLAVSQAKAGKYDDAYDTYSAIIDLDEKAADAYYLRGKVSLSQGDKNSALADYDMAIALEPTDYDIYILICKDLNGAGYETDGKAYIQRAMNTDYRKSEYQKGVFNYYIGEYEKAKENFEDSRGKRKDTTDLIVYLGKTYEALGDYNYAASLYTDYLTDNPDDPEVCLQLGLNKLTQCDYDGALLAFETGIATENVEYMQTLKFNRIAAYEYKLEFKKAAVLMEEYLAEYPNDEEAEREYKFLKTR